MATYQKRKKGITATVRIKPHPSQSQTFSTMRDAKAWAQELELKLKNEKKGDYNHILLKDVLEEYRDSVSITKKGFARERTRINQFLKIMNVDIPVTDIDFDYLVKYRESRLEEVSSMTARREMQVLGAIFTWCVDTKLYLKHSPMHKVRLPKASDHRERVISNTEIETLLPFLNDELKAIFLLALETGMRQSEICDLEWERIHLDKSFLFLKTTKNGRSREVPLSKNAKDILIDLGVKKSGSVFVYEAKYASVDFMKARIEANLLDIVFHDTRHTAATRVAQKLPLLDLCKMFGWTDPKRAMIYYNPTASEIASRL
ncbi:tyrosine-type recombinase/integrase [Acinetobacter colistiniresistens]|uniref:tyrosine-type recombinase/integrase n=1 Tax=Acinetobacter colistiniresistens TaxID=280145 RepID=UPI00124FCF5F|nr:site-specific integrase [Acinetobacter colistiniresistens]